MSRHIKNPIQYFEDNPYIEGRLISFEYMADTVNIVLEFMGQRETNMSKDEDSTMEFRLLHFSDITKYKRIVGKRDDLQNAENSYNMSDYSSVHVVQGLDVTAVQDYYYFDMWMDASLGGLSFCFSSICEDRKVGIGKENDHGSFDYYDWKTKKKFSFYEPFMDLKQ